MTRWLLAAQSVIGYPSKTLLEDAHAYCQMEDGFCGVISDGAGSASQASFASHWVVHEGLLMLKHSFVDISVDSFEPILSGVLKKLRDDLQSRAIEDGQALCEYACTGLFFVIKNRTLFFAQVGDGFAVTGFEGVYTLRVLGERGEYVNETNFLVDTPLKLQITIVADPVDFLAIGTDGLESVSIEKKEGTAFEGFFKPFDLYLASCPTAIEAEKELQSFLSSEALLKRSRDDKTLFIARTLGA